MENQTTTLLAGAAVALGALRLLLALLALRRAGAAKRALGELMSEGEATTGGAQLARALAGVAEHATRLAVSEGRLTELEAAADRAVSRVDTSSSRPMTTRELDRAVHSPSLMMAGAAL